MQKKKDLLCRFGENIKVSDLKLIDLLLHIPNWVDKGTCKKIIDDSLHLPTDLEYSSTPEGTYKESTMLVRTINPSSAGGNILLDLLSQGIEQYKTYLYSFKSFHDDSIKFKCFNYAHLLRILEYREGCSIHSHSDHMLGIYGSCTINLNEDYEGGDFIFFRGKHKIQLKTGDLLIFPADYFWIHEVSPITKNVRYSFNTFLCNYNFQDLLETDKNLSSSKPEYLLKIPNLDYKLPSCLTYEN